MYSSHVHWCRRERLLEVETERDGVNRWANGSRLERTLAERTRSVNGFILQRKNAVLQVIVTSCPSPGGRGLDEGSHVNGARINSRKL